MISAVTADSAVTVAEQVAPHLRAPQIYIDLNSVSPATKERVAGPVRASGADFVEFAVMAPVKEPGIEVPILSGGEKAEEVSSRLNELGMKITPVSTGIGTASATKLCRSIVIKGMEALLLECALAAGEYDAADRVYESLAQTYPGMDWRKTAEYMIGRVLEHGERRAHEMEEVAATLRAAGIDPLMAEAAARRQDWEATARDAGRLTGKRPQSAGEMLRLLVDPRTSRTVQDASN